MESFGDLILQTKLDADKILSLNGIGPKACLLYTSDAADDLLCVDLGGRRTIKKKKQPSYLSPYSNYPS